VHGEGGVRVGADINGAIIIVVMGNRDPLSSGELLFQVMNDGFLLLPSECNDSLSYGCSLVLLPLGGDGGHDGGDDLLLVDEEVGGAAWHGWQYVGG
jgi:hypothetical protein